MLCLGMHSNVIHCFMVQALQDPPLCSSTVDSAALSPATCDLSPYSLPLYQPVPLCCAPSTCPFIPSFSATYLLFLSLSRKLLTLLLSHRQPVPLFCASPSTCSLIPSFFINLFTLLSPPRKLIPSLIDNLSPHILPVSPIIPCP